MAKIKNTQFLHPLFEQFRADVAEALDHAVKRAADEMLGKDRRVLTTLYPGDDYWFTLAGDRNEVTVYRASGRKDVFILREDEWLEMEQ